MRPARLLLLVHLVALSVGTAARADDVDGYLSALRSPDALRRNRAALALAEVQDPRAADRILKGLVVSLVDANDGVRHATAIALTRRGDRRGAPALLRQLQVEEDPRVLPALLLGVGALGDATSVPAVLPFARTHRVAAVRAAAVTALGDLGGEDARQVALATVRDPGLPDGAWSLRVAAILALSRCGQPSDVGPVLIAAREGGGDDHWLVRSALARLVAQRDADPVPLLRRMVGDPDRRVAATAAEGLARSGHEEVLLSLFGHVVPSIRAAAVSGVAKARVERAYPNLRALARLDPSREVRWAAARALFDLEDPLGDELMLQGLAASQPTVWAEAVAALVERTGERHGRDVEAWRAAVTRWRARQ